MSSRLTAVVVLALLATSARADDLADAKAAYAESVAVAREELLDSFTDAVKAAAEAGELVSVTELVEQKEAFEKAGELPTNRFIKEAVEAYESAEKEARGEVVKAYETALSDLTKSAKFEEARKVGNALQAIKNGGVVGATGTETETTTPPPKPRPSDPVLAELQEAKEEYQADYDEVAKQLLADIDERILELSKAGQLDAIEAVQKLREEFESTGNIENPADDDVKFAKAKFDRALTRHVRAMTASYRKAIGRYRRAKNTEGVEKLEAELAAWTADAGRPTGTSRVIDLIRLVDVKFDAKPTNKWSVKDGSLYCTDGGLVPKVVFPYEPPREYDFSMEFMQPNLRNDLGMIMPNRAGSTFYWGIGGRDSLFLLRAASDPQPFKRNLKGAFRPGVKYRTRVQVREKEVRTYVNGRLIYAYKGDLGNLGVDNWHRTEATNQLAVFADDPTMFSKITVKEVSGPGRVIREATN